MTTININKNADQTECFTTYLQNELVYKMKTKEKIDIKTDKKKKKSNKRVNVFYKIL